jgi:hypothetical protein
MVPVRSMVPETTTGIACRDRAQLLDRHQSGLEAARVEAGFDQQNSRRRLRPGLGLQ